MKNFIEYLKDFRLEDLAYAYNIDLEKPSDIHKLAQAIELDCKTQHSALSRKEFE